jgi:hypothetical protein
MFAKVGIKTNSKSSEPVNGQDERSAPLVLAVRSQRQIGNLEERLVWIFIWIGNTKVYLLQIGIF